MAKQSKCFLLSWDMYGLESVIPISQLEAAADAAEKQRLVDILSHPELQDSGNSTGRTLQQLLSTLLLRARVNSQRHYEVYSIHVEPSITGEDLREMFNRDPQGSAELIRERGNKIWSDRVSHKQLIT